MYSKKVLVGFVAAAISLGSAGAFAQDRYDDGRYNSGYDDGAGYDYAKVVDVQPLVTRVRVTTPQRECWDETRYDDRGYGNGPMPRSSAGGAVLGAVIGGVLGHQIGSGRGRDAATAAGAVIGAAVGSKQAQRRGGYAAVPPREYPVQRCETLSRIVGRAYLWLPRDLCVQRPPPGDRAALSPR